MNKSLIPLVILCTVVMIFVVIVNHWVFSEFDEPEKSAPVHAQTPAVVIKPSEVLGKGELPVIDPDNDPLAPVPVDPPKPPKELPPDADPQYEFAVETPILAN